jgi:hypothetical protein
MAPCLHRLPDALLSQANAVCSILDDPSLKLRMLSSRCTAERLGEACSVLLQLASSQGKGCTVM